MDLNKAMIIGNLTRDPETRTTTTGQTVCSFGVATNRVWNDASGQKQTQVEFHNIVTWSRLAEICGQYLAKGRKVFIEGRLQTREWEGQDGAKRQRTEIIAENLIILDRAAGKSPTGAGAPVSETSQPAAESESVAPSEEGIKVENIPF